MRLFVGARVSVATANELAACAETLARRANDARVDIRWVAPASYHVTLKFLGATRDDAVAAVRDALDDCCRGVSPMKVRTERLGAFPSLERASVVWAGAPSEPLAQLAASIDRALATLGFEAEKRAFHGHVTLGRVRGQSLAALRDVVLPLAEQVFGETSLDAITLFESETKSSGSVYRELARVAFKPAQKAPERQSAPLELEETDDGWPRGQ